MSYSKAVLTGAVILGGAHAIAEEKVISVNDLSKFGINEQKVRSEFKNQFGFDLNSNESIQVGRDAEGKHIRFETLDHHSITVDIYAASGPFNKAISREEKY